jgi:hypothetical protein
MTDLPQVNEFHGVKGTNRAQQSLAPSGTLVGSLIHR